MEELEELDEIGQEIVRSIFRLDFEGFKRKIDSTGFDINKHFINNQEPMKGNHLSIMYLVAGLTNLEFLRYVFEKGGRSRLNRINGYIPIYGAIKNRKNDLVQFLVDNEDDYNTENLTSDTPLTYACSLSNLEAVQILLNKGLDVNYQKKSDGFTLVHIACEKNNMRLLDLLIEKGANLNVLNRRKESALEIAIVRRHIDIVHKMIYTPGINVNLKSRDEFTPFMIASMVGNLELMEMIYNHPLANINIYNSKMENAAFYAVHKSNIPLFKYLVSIGINIFQIDSDGNSLLHHAAMYDSIDMIILLLSLGLDINKQNKNFMTPLFISFYTNKPNVCKCLLENGAETYITGKENYTLMDFAINDFNLWKIIIDYSPRLISYAMNNVRCRDFLTRKLIAYLLDNDNRYLRYLLENLKHRDDIMLIKRYIYRLSEIYIVPSSSIRTEDLKYINHFVFQKGKKRQRLE